VRPETEAALAAVAAAQRVLSARAGADRITSKGGRDLVTDADLAAEDAIRAELGRRFPSYPVVGEERGGAPGANGRAYWLVDPLCGTRMYASGLPLFCTNVALVESGRVTVAVVGEGASENVYLAEAGGGTRVQSGGDFRPIRPSDASGSLWVDANSTRASAQTVHAANFLRAAILRDRWYIWMYGTSVAYAHLAAGRIAGIVHFDIASPVHSAAGCLLAAEAGALVTDLDGRPWTLASRAFIATATPTLHRELLDLVAATRDFRK
jgi:myo-inositol-1(or 4)-monophosphatase